MSCRKVDENEDVVDVGLEDCDDLYDQLEDEDYIYDIKSVRRERKRESRRAMKVDGAGLKQANRIIVQNARKTSERTKNWGM